MNYYNFELLKTNPAANFNRPYQQCAISLMNTIADPYITFDNNGICNYYKDYKKAEEKSVLKGIEAQKELEKIIDKVKKDGKNKKYDCITGVSGGVDSTYLVLQLHKLGLRPLIVHFDNGWNSEIAVKNIENIITKTGFNLYTLVVDWEEFKDLQRSYFYASVVDIEVPTDHAIRATLSMLAKKNKIKYIFSGGNVVTEQVLPRYWIYSKSDHINLKSIHKKFGTVPLKTYPLFDYSLKNYEKLNNVQVIYLLDYFNYNKANAKKTITDELNWTDYGGKHFESVFTKFYQAYILPRKFMIDKRIAHLSNLIFSGQITKQEAENEISNELYTKDELDRDYEFVIKKLGFSVDEFETILNIKRIEHSFYKIEKGFWNQHWYFKPLRSVHKLFFK